jgi:ABC-type transport system substrate-binding protein/class 3 adenylate cyclase/DNA-binding XRE family transcriptional regulator
MPDWPAMTALSSLTFADLLRYHRAASGLTQEELAARAGLSSDAISTLERGARRWPRKDTVALLAAALALPDEERAAFAAAARRSSAAALAATPPVEATAGLDGHAPEAADLDGHMPGSAATLPHGVVTFLIGEIEDSAHLLRELGDRYAGVLDEVHALLRTVWAAHTGHELGTQGDRFFAVFAYADDALAAAAAAQQALAAHSWPEGAPVRLRMGLHSGDALVTAGRYVGQEVHRAARIAAAGHGGQVVVSDAVADQVAKFGYALPAGTSLRDLGKHRLQDLPHCEELYQLVLPDVPGLPAAFPPLRTLDAWPGLRADLTVVVGMSAVLLAVVGLVLALVVPAFPWAIGLGAAGLALLVLLGVVLAQPVRHALETQWRDARKPFAAVSSALLSLAVISTTLFITKPPIFIGPQHAGYDFSYTYHRPTHTGGSVVVSTWEPIGTLAPWILPQLPLGEGYYGLWNGCVVQLPDLKLGLAGWKADQCTEVPTVANGGESRDGRTTIFHIDPRAVWSDGQPITADDFLFTFRLVMDPNVDGTLWGWSGPVGAPFSLMQLTKLDAHTVRIDWSVPYGDYLAALAQLTPLPLHAYARGQFAGVYDPVTGVYNSALAQGLAADASFNLTIPVDNGPFTVQRVEGYPGSYDPTSADTAQRVVLARNPRFFSQVFHQPVLDQVTFESLWKQSPPHQAPNSNFLTLEDALTAAYKQGGMTLALDLVPLDLSHLGGIPTGEVVNSPAPDIWVMGFNRRDVAPNARANGGVSIFEDLNVRTALTEAFDRCAALRAVLGIHNCTDPTFRTDELTAPPASDYDPTVTLPAFNPAGAAALLDRAGYRVVNGVRRYRDGATPLELTVSLSLAALPYAGFAQRLQQDYARYLHITVRILNPPGSFFGQGSPSVTGAFDIGLWGDGWSPDPVGHIAAYGWTSASIPSAQNASGAGANFLGLIDPLVLTQDQLGSQEIDADQRAEVYQELQRHVAQQIDFVPLLIQADTALVQPTLCNFKKWPALGENLWNMADWYVAPSCPS